MQARHSATVTSYMPSAKGLASVTLWLGRSLASPEADPMVKLPAGTCTMIGHSGQSRKLPVGRLPGEADTGGAGATESSGPDFLGSRWGGLVFARWPQKGAGAPPPGP